MKQLLIILIGLLMMWTCDTVQRNNPEFDANELSDYIRYLASEELQGRAPGTEGDKAAAEFIKKKFEEAGLKLLGEEGFQYFEVTTGINFGDNNSLTVDQIALDIGEHYTPFNFSGSGEVMANVVFAGYGFTINSDSLNWDDYAGIDASDKWILVLRADPDLDNMDSPFAQFSTDRYKVMNALDHGAAGVLLVNSEEYDSDDNLEKLKKQRGVSASKIPVIQVKRAIANSIIERNHKTLKELEEHYKTRSAPLSFSTNKIVIGKVDLVTEKARTMNVVGLLEGQSDEIIILGAHYDHLGMGGESSRTPDTVAVHYGADDNASGTAMLIEMVQKISSSKPESSILFIAFGAEEMGLLGSRYFVDNPLVDMQKVKTMFNFDMVGRLNDERSLLISGTGTALETDSLLDIGLDSTLFAFAKSPGGTGPSDHATFYGEEIPVLFFSTGVHDQYHTPADKADLINYDGMVDLGNSIYSLFRLYDDNDLKLTFFESQEPQRQGMRKRMKVTLGIVPDFANQEPGLGVAGVRAGGPAYNGGMKKGDIIKAIDDKEVTNIHDYMYRMANYSKEDRITVEVLRDGKKEMLIIIL